MKFLIVFCLMISSNFWSQQRNEFWVWVGGGIQTKINSKLDLTVDLNSRLNNFTSQLFYPEISLKYKIKKWFKPSVDYRGLITLNKYGNYKFSNRLNFNFNFEKSIKKLTLGFRIRYQYVFTGIQYSENYSPEFDETIRLKPSLKYDLKKNRFTPTLSTEWFYDPTNGPLGHQFSNIRTSIGVNINLPGSNIMSLNYLFDQRLNGTSITNDKSKNILQIYYCYIIGEKKKKK